MVDLTNLLTKTEEVILGEFNFIVSEPTVDEIINLQQFQNKIGIGDSKEDMKALDALKKVVLQNIAENNDLSDDTIKEIEKNLNASVLAGIMQIMGNLVHSGEKKLKVAGKSKKVTGKSKSTK